MSRWPTGSARRSSWHFDFERRSAASSPIACGKTIRSGRATTHRPACCLPKLRNSKPWPSDSRKPWTDEDKLTALSLPSSSRSPAGRGGGIFCLLLGIAIWLWPTALSCHLGELGIVNEERDRQTGLGNGNAIDVDGHELL